MNSLSQNVNLETDVLDDLTQTGFSHQERIVRVGYFCKKYQLAKSGVRKTRNSVVLFWILDFGFSSPIPSISDAIAKAVGRLWVPLKAMCSKKWERPLGSVDLSYCTRILSD